MKRELLMEGVGRRYGLGGPWVLRGVDLTLAPGTLVRVEGANGKSTHGLCTPIAPQGCNLP